jgi:hypothetical protein
MYDVARIVAADFARTRKISGDAMLAAIPQHEREAIEERASILEFDANLPRDLATRISFSNYLGRMRR